MADPAALAAQVEELTRRLAQSETAVSNMSAELENMSLRLEQSSAMADDAGMTRWHSVDGPDTPFLRSV